MRLPGDPRRAAASRRAKKIVELYIRRMNDGEMTIPHVRIKLEDDIEEAIYDAATSTGT